MGCYPILTGFWNLTKLFQVGNLCILVTKVFTLKSSLSLHIIIHLQKQKVYNLLGFPFLQIVKYINKLNNCHFSYPIIFNFVTINVYIWYVMNKPWHIYKFNSTLSHYTYSHYTCQHNLHCHTLYIYTHTIHIN